MEKREKEEHLKRLGKCFPRGITLDGIVTGTDSIVTFFAFCLILGHFGYNKDGYRASGQKGFRLQSPAKFIEHEVGNCWDMTELQREWFERHGYTVRTFLLYYYLRDDCCPSHSILVYQKDEAAASEGDGKIVWFEPMFYSTPVEYSGLHEYQTEVELLKDLKRVFTENAQKMGILPEVLEEERWALYEYARPEYGISDEEFYDHCRRGKEMTGLLM